MNTATRIRILETRLNYLTTKCPLRVKVAIVAELRALGWGRAA